MIVDSSGLLAIILDEPESNDFIDILENGRTVRMSVASYLDVAVHLERNCDERQRTMLDTFVRQFDIQLEPVTIEQIRLARQAFDFVGKGRQPAALNFGDCFTYALATHYMEPLLFKGNDFLQTDLESPPAQLH